MAAPTQKSTIASGSAASTYTTGSFNPTVGELLFAVVSVSSSNLASPTFSLSDGSTFTLIGSSDNAPGRMYFFVADALSASTSSVTGTFNCTGDAGSGCVAWIGSQSGITRSGAAAIRQFAKEENQTTGTPEVVFGVSCLTDNPTLVAFMTDDSNTVPPTNWTEVQDTRLAALQCTQEVAVRASGFTNTTVTWGQSESGYSTLGVEFDLSAPSVGTRTSSQIF